MGYSPWGHKELELTESLIHTRCVRNGSDVFSFIHSSHSVIYSFIGEMCKLVISILLKNFFGVTLQSIGILLPPRDGICTPCSGSVES